MIPRRFAVVFTHNRPDLLKDCVAAIGPQVDVVIVVDNASQPAITTRLLEPGCDDDYRVVLVTVPDQPPNLSRLWNIGIQAATSLRHDEEGPWHVAVLCDDTVAPPGWFDAVVAAMESTGAAAGCSNPFGHEHEPRLKTAADHDISGRMPGWAWILDGRKKLAADESMAWWWCDTDIDWQARAAGGMVMIGGHRVPNRLPNDFITTVPGLAEQAGRDGEAFAAKWGGRPW